MKPRLLELTLILAGAAGASSAGAQPAAPKAPNSAEAPQVAAAPAAATARVPMRASGTAVFTAAGSVIVLTDGVVSRASIVSIQPPAPGFVYER